MPPELPWERKAVDRPESIVYSNYKNRILPCINKMTHYPVLRSKSCTLIITIHRHRHPMPIRNPFLSIIPDGDKTEPWEIYTSSPNGIAMLPCRTIEFLKYPPVRGPIPPASRPCIHRKPWENTTNRMKIQESWDASGIGPTCLRMGPSLPWAMIFVHIYFCVVPDRVSPKLWHPPIHPNVTIGKTL